MQALGEDIKQKTPANTLESLGYKEELKRTMSLTDVVIYGLIYMCPMAPIAVFGFIYNSSSGMAALVYLAAAAAMVFSAICYKEMAKRYPVAGSVYSYVRFGTNPFLGYAAGWAILLDYLLLPALLSSFSASAMTGVWPAVPVWIWVVAFVIIAALINRERDEHPTFPFAIAAARTAPSPIGVERDGRRSR